MAATLLSIGGAYLALGLLVGVVFVVWGIERLDANAKDAWAFRPLLLPGMMLIWPLVLWRWRVLAKGWDEARRHQPPRAAQDWAGVALALAIPVIVVTVLVIRQNGPFERPAVQISPPTEEVAQ